MGLIIASVTLFIVLLLFPVIASSLHLRKPADSALVNIRQDYVRNPRYFGKSFASLMKKALEKYDGSGKIMLSRQNDLIEAGSKDIPEVCAAIVYAKNSFKPPEGVTFNGEVYCEDRADFIGIPKLRAVYAEGPLTIGAGTEVTRWMDCEDTIIIYDHCVLGVSVTSEMRIIIGADAVFHRLYAPVIHMGADLTKPGMPVETRSAERTYVHGSPLHRNIRFVDEGMSPDGDGIVTGTVISRHDVAVLEGITLLGNIRSHKTVIVHDGACVHGNIFAEGNVYVGSGAKVFGNIFTQQDMFVDQSASLGQYGEVKSFIARGNITIENNCRVHGYISAEKRGLCCPDASKFLAIAEELDTTAMPEKLEAPAVLPVTKSAVFAKAADFDTMSAQVFRKNRHLEEMVIPEGVTDIRSSFFYECETLRSVTLPATLRTIGDYAFYGCSALAEINLESCKHLKEIGAHAFDGCISLQTLRLPDYMQSLGEAAFYGCTGLTSLRIGKRQNIYELPGHVFFGCKALRSLELPLSLRAIGTSAFYGCASLKKLRVPAHVGSIGGFAFYGCDSLQTLVIDAISVAHDDNLFAGLPEKAAVSVGGRPVEVRAGAATLSQ